MSNTEDARPTIYFNKTFQAPVDQKFVDTMRDFEYNQRLANDTRRNKNEVRRQPVAESFNMRDDNSGHTTTSNSSRENSISGDDAEEFQQADDSSNPFSTNKFKNATNNMTSERPKTANSFYHTGSLPAIIPTVEKSSRHFHINHTHKVAKDNHEAFLVVKHNLRNGDTLSNSDIILKDTLDQTNHEAFQQSAERGLRDTLPPNDYYFDGRKQRPTPIGMLPLHPNSQLHKQRQAFLPKSAIGVDTMLHTRQLNTENVVWNNNSHLFHHHQ